MTHPDEQIDTEYRKAMNDLARGLDRVFNDDKKGKDREVCFVLLTAPFNTSGGRVNYISNGKRPDIVTMLKEILARFEGQAEMQGRA